jgi:SAM-dependent methyltransferase
MYVGSDRTAINHAYVGQHMFDLIRNHCGLTSSSTVLDLGCGCGRVATPLAGYLTNGVYHGIDIAEPLIGWCRDNISTRYPHFHFHHADLSNSAYRTEGRAAVTYTFPFDDSHFDVIFATSLFTHLLPEAARHYANEIARVLKPLTGRAFLTFFLMNDAYRRRRKTAQIDFRYQYDGCSVSCKEKPESAVAYEERDAVVLLRNASLSIESLSLGKWIGNPGWTFQDVFVVSRRPHPEW